MHGDFIGISYARRMHENPRAVCLLKLMIHPAKLDWRLKKEPLKTSEAIQRVQKTLSN